ncbi:MAM and LDL-receptor class A domain-containing protein 1-like [Mizuhopecten yessoensis]|uniref:Apical endosomal glycoprotein n=1 Tax=Mizuhopecten yessoensis TaxID=6573 RepID=A0A210QGS2_MIZYE|nr:MAM and LDL-receptor class A domain-containing protein 1-like [Mizuhopecten yessoensis]OWF47916.1 Apical endosomal glycoprotein [Mizuhopecten yessoensis]
METTQTVLWAALFLIALIGLVAADSPFAGRVSKISSCASVKLLDQIRNASCSFDKDLCSYQNLNHDARWVVKNDKVGGFFGIGGTGQHTNNNGYFVQPDVSNSRAAGGTSFELALPEMPVGTVCIDFWYDKRAKSTSNLQVIVECPNGRRNLAWNGHTSSNSWKQAGLLLHMETQYKVIFKMEKEDSSHVTGLDDVNVYNVNSTTIPQRSQGIHCEQTTPAVYLDEMTTPSIPQELNGNDTAIDCTFENNSCSWHLGKDSNFDWHLGDSEEAQGLSAPRSDHTTGGGSYAYIRGSEVRSSTWKAVLQSNTIDSDVHLQFSFWFIMSGAGVGSLTLYQNVSGDDRRKVWSRVGRQGPDWTQAVIDLPPGMYTLQFEATTKYHYMSDLAIDDTVLTNITVTTTTAAPTTTKLTPVPLPISCDFEVNTCGFLPPVTDPGYVQWERTLSPLTVLSRVYVTGDNTTGSGTFLSLQAMSAEAHRGDVASIVSPALEPQTGACLRLAYIMPSTLSGTITVFKRQVRTGELHLLEHLSGYYGPHWRSLQVDLWSDTPFQIEIKGSYAGEPGAVIGVDDMSLENNPCPTTTTSTTTTTALPLPPFEVGHMCDAHDEQDIADMSCSFDSSVCSYSSVGDKLQWIQLNNSYHVIPGGKTGPYIVLDTAKISTPHGSIAQLKSPVFNGSDVCLTFWYINPSLSSNLGVWLEFTSGVKTMIWSTDGHEHSDWQAVSLSVKTETAYKLVFQSKKTDTFGPVGIDEISVFESSSVIALPSSTTTQTTSTIRASEPSTIQPRTTSPSATVRPMSDLVTSSSTTLPTPSSIYLPNTTVNISEGILTSKSVSTPQVSKHTILQTSFTNTSPVSSSTKQVTSPSTVSVTSLFKSTSTPSTTVSTSASTLTLTSTLAKTVTSQAPNIATSPKTKTLVPSVSETVTSDNSGNSKTTEASSNGSSNEKSTDSSISMETKALAIGFSVSVFGICSVVLAVYLLKKNRKVTNQKDKNVPMHDINNKNIKSQAGNTTSQVSSVVNVVGYKKLDV